MAVLPKDFSKTLGRTMEQIYDNAYMGNGTPTVRRHQRILKDTFEDGIEAHEAFKTPVETLFNLWKARFGNGWVDENTFDNDNFFEITAVRLLQLGKLERYTFGHKTIIRMPE